ncbi:MAG: ABC transporter ATP-binding protein [Quadrisphaera sp.]
MGIGSGLQERNFAKAAPPAAPRGEAISIAAVSYRYDAEAGRASAASSGSAGSDVLRGVSLQVRPGERLAIIGPSGAGKTTLGRLIAGDDHPHRGTVSVGGVPIADLPPQVRRHHVVMVTQDHHVFAESLRDNLLLTAPEATDAQLLAALGVVRAAWVDDLPAGLDTDLGSHRLSGAQAQVLALARVVLAGPHTIVLDEATALLDPRSARQTEEALAAAVSGRTTIAIAHRLSTARAADRVVVMAEGRIVEIGTHEQLLVAEGTYAAMWRAWSPD